MTSDAPAELHYFYVAITLLINDTDFKKVSCSVKCFEKRPKTAIENIKAKIRQNYPNDLVLIGSTNFVEITKQMYELRKDNAALKRISLEFEYSDLY